LFIHFIQFYDIAKQHIIEVRWVGNLADRGVGNFTDSVSVKLPTLKSDKSYIFAP